MKRAARGVAALAVAMACGPVDAPPEAHYVANECPCSGYRQPGSPGDAKCNGGMCVWNATFKPHALVLVVSFPDGSRNYAGVTLASYASDLTSPQTSACKNDCVQVPNPAGDIGYLALDPHVGAAAGVGVDLGNPRSTSIPVQVLFYPEQTYTVGATTAYVSTEALGLPLLPVRALSGGASISGPNGSPGYGWRQTLGAGDYERDVVPVDDRFPPIISHLRLTSTPNGPQELPIGAVDDQATPANRELPVSWPEQDLRGFRVYLRDHTTHHRASSRVTISEAAPGPVVLNTIGIADVQKANLEKVLEPPDATPIPSFVDQLTPLPSGGDTLGKITMPRLPPPVEVTGTLEAAGGVPAEGDIFFDSTTSTSPTDTHGIVIIPDANRDGKQALHYSTAVHTAASGRYDVVLPAGEYEVFARPSDPNAGGGASAVKLYDESKHAQTFTGSTFAALHGVVRTGDGRALPGAVVEARPAASLAATLDPRMWPRVRSTTTDANGAYALLVEPGQIDLVVSPVAGTGFPSVVEENLVLTDGQSVDHSISVAAPIVIDLVLHDPADNPVADALVRAYYAPPTDSGTAAAAIPVPAVALGQAMSDATGRIQLLLLPPVAFPSAP